MSWRPDALIVHETQMLKKATGAMVSGIILVVACAFPDLENAAAVMAGERQWADYGRYGNSATLPVERRIARPEREETGVWR